MSELKVPFDRLLANPREYFDSPDDVVETSGLNDDEKLKILESWQHDALELQKAEEENMMGGEVSRLSEVRAAIDRLTR